MGYAEGSGKRWRARYKRPDGAYGSESGFATKTAAKRYADDQEAKIRASRWIDPDAGAITLDDYTAKWLIVQDLAPRTSARYDSYYRNHISPELGARQIKSIAPLEIDALEKALGRHRAPATVAGVMQVLRLLMADAAHDRLIESSPVRAKRRRGKRTGPDTRTRRGMAVELEAVQAIRARQVRAVSIMVLMAVFTGMRWGEVAGARRKYLVLMPDAPGGPCGYYLIDPQDGALHEAEDGALTYGPTKTRRGRTVELPPFLVELLAAYLDTLPTGQQELFPTPSGASWRRSNFARQWWRPACDGWPQRSSRGGHGVALEAAAPIVAGLRFHDLRHTHETWLMEDKIERVARDERLGHVTPGMEGTYGHATAKMRADILAVLQARWERYWSTVSS
ncbi:MAG: tyrosine-type recombinase/integrase [Actinocrinis sp.]